jgi:hypothetical protein
MAPQLPLELLVWIQVAVSRLRAALADHDATGIRIDDLLAVTPLTSGDLATVATRRRRLAAMLHGTGLDASEVIVVLELTRTRAWILPREFQRLIRMPRGLCRLIFPVEHDNDGLARRLRRALGVRTPRRERPRCGARTRAGGTCRGPAVWDHERDQPRTRRGRCRLHGGASTGPRTQAGRDAARAALDRVNAERRNRQALVAA